MPVNLSRIGLEGIETAQRTLNSMAQREALASQTAIAEAEEERKAEDRAIDQWAAGALDSIGKGDGLPKGSGGNSLIAVDDDDPASVFGAIGQRYFRAGAPKRGKEFIEGGMKLRKDQFDIDKGRDEQSKIRLSNMIAAGDWVARNIGENENEYALFLGQLDDPNNPIAKIIGEDNIAALKSTEWSPDLANYFRAKALSVKDQATLALTERGQDRADRNLSMAEKRFAALGEIARANLEERKKENTRKDKADGPNVGKAPTNDERDTAFSSILNSIKALGGIKPAKDTPERIALDNMTDDIVGRAKIITTENKGLTFPEAVEQAVAEADAAGDFGILEKVEEGFFFDTKTKTPSYKRKGTAKNPLPLPKTRAALIPGRYYVDANGTVEQYKAP